MQTLLNLLQQRATHWHNLLRRGVALDAVGGVPVAEHVMAVVAAGVGVVIAAVAVTGAVSRINVAKQQQHEQQQQQQQLQHEQQQQQHLIAVDAHPNETQAILQFINSPPCTPPSTTAPTPSLAHSLDHSPLAHAHSEAPRDVLYIHAVLRGVGYRGDGQMIVTVGVGECCSGRRLVLLYAALCCLFMLFQTIAQVSVRRKRRQRH